MSVGDEIGLTEELYQQMIGKLQSLVEVLAKRVQVKDQALFEKDKKIQELEEALKDKVSVKPSSK